MQHPNEHGNYQAEITEELARRYLRHPEKPLPLATAVFARQADLQQ
jgi:hypothetical protein